MGVALFFIAFSLLGGRGSTFMPFFKTLQSQLYFVCVMFHCVSPPQFSYPAIKKSFLLIGNPCENCHWERLPLLPSIVAIRKVVFPYFVSRH